MEATLFTSKVYGCGWRLHFSPAKSMAAAGGYTFHQQSLWLRLEATLFTSKVYGYIFHQQSLWLRLHATFFTSKVYGCGCMLHFFLWDFQWLRLYATLFHKSSKTTKNVWKMKIKAF